MEDSGIPESTSHRFLDGSSYVLFHALSIRPEDGEFVVGRVDAGTFVAMPDVGARAIELLGSGRTVGSVRKLLEDEYGEEVDLDDFVNNLIDLGFVKSIDGHELPVEEPRPPNLPWLKPHHVRWIFTCPVHLLYVAVLAAAAVSLASRPELLPRYKDFFWTDVTSLLILSGLLLSTLILAGHELAHLVAARSLGVPARIGFGTRLTKLVVETDVTGVWSVPRGQRYRVYLAGMAWDLLMIAFAILTLAYGSPSHVVDGLLRVFILIAFLGIIAQFAFYMRTDVYFVVMDLLRCRNLFEDSVGNFRYTVRRFRSLFEGQRSEEGLLNPLAPLSPHERSKVQVYTWFMVVGTVWSLAFFVLYSLPIFVGLCLQATESIAVGTSVGKLWMVADGGLTLAVEIGFQAVFVRTLVRNKRHWFDWFWQRFAFAVAFRRLRVQS